MISMTSKELFKFFQSHFICESLTREDVEKLISFLQEKWYETGEVISDTGEVGDSLGFIIEGKVKFTSGKGSEEAEVGKQGEGSLIGEMSFFDGKPRNLKMSACKKGVKLFILTKPMYDRLKVEQPYIAVNILENAIVSLDTLIRHMGDDINALENYVHGFGKR